MQMKDERTSRIALLIASAKGAAPDADRGFAGDRELRQAGELAKNFARELSHRGQWSIYEGSPLIDPDEGMAEKSIRSAVKLASSQAKPLLIHFIGHARAQPCPNGLSRLLLQLPGEHPLPGGAAAELDILAVIRETLTDAVGIDGVILLIDACSTGDVPLKASIDFAELTSGRLEVLVASDAPDMPAFDGKFTQALADVLRTGLPGEGAYLHPARLLTYLAKACSGQAPRQISLNSGRVNAAGFFDEGLWLARNASVRQNALTGRPDAARVESLLRDMPLSDAQREILVAIDETKNARLRIIRGPAGSGKSAIAAALIEPELATQVSGPRGLRLPQLVSAAVFLDPVSTPGGVAVELATQLGESFPAFWDAHEKVRILVDSGDYWVKRADLDTAERHLLRPLAEWLGRHPTERAHLLLDGIDQLAPEHRQAFHDMVRRLVSDKSLTRVRLIMTERSGQEFETFEPCGGQVHAISAPTWADAAHAFGWGNSFRNAYRQDAEIPGGWLTARLLTVLPREILLRVMDGARDVQEDGGHTTSLFFAQITTAARDYAVSSLGRLGGLAEDVLAILSVTTLGPTLPLAVLLGTLPDSLSLSDLRTVLAALEPLIQRGQAGTDNEHVGIAHAELHAQLQLKESWRAAESHAAVQHAISQKFTDKERKPSPEIRRYALEAWAGHAFAAGDGKAGVSALEVLDDPGDPRGTYERWNSAATEIEALLGPVAPGTLTMRNSRAGWLGESGGGPGAVAGFREVLPLRRTHLGEADEATLRSWNSLALWMARTGDLDKGLAEFEKVLAVRRAVLGMEHRDTLRTWNNYAYWLGIAGNVRASLAGFRILAPLRRKANDVTPGEALRTRNNYAYWLGQAGYLREALEEFRSLLRDRRTVWRDEHREALRFRINEAEVLMMAGRYDLSLQSYRSVVPAQERSLGERHPDTLESRGGLAILLGLRGDAAAARYELRTIVNVQREVLGEEHYVTLRFTSELGRWTVAAGARSEGIRILRKAIDYLDRRYGETHVYSLRARGYLASARRTRQMSARIATELRLLVCSTIRIYGKTHPDVLLTRREYALALRRSGRISEALRELTRTLALQERRLGKRHPATLETAAALQSMASSRSHVL